MVSFFFRNLCHVYQTRAETAIFGILWFRRYGIDWKPFRSNNPRRKRPSSSTLGSNPIQISTGNRRAATSGKILRGFPSGHRSRHRNVRVNRDLSNRLRQSKRVPSTQKANHKSAFLQQPRLLLRTRRVREPYCKYFVVSVIPPHWLFVDVLEPVVRKSEIFVSRVWFFAVRNVRSYVEYQQYAVSGRQ